MFDVVCFGEILIDFTPVRVGEEIFFEKNPGGAPANVAVGLSKLGAKTAYIGKAGNDAFGTFLKETLDLYGVNTSGFILSDEFNTTLAFVELDAKGERNFSFIRKNGADIKIKPEEINLDLIKNARVFHFGSLSMTDEPSLTTTFYALENVKGYISFDPNLRVQLWKSLTIAKERIIKALEYSHILKVSEEELYFITDIYDIKKSVEYLRANYPLEIILITIGEKGSYFSIESGADFVDAFKVEVVDTTGAGDSFLAGFLYYALKHNLLEEHDRNNVKEAVRFGNACAAITVGKRGAIPALPVLSEVENVLYL